MRKALYEPPGGAPVRKDDVVSGDLDVSLLHCPACGLVLAAEVEPQADSGRVGAHSQKRAKAHGAFLLATG